MVLEDGTFPALFQKVGQKPRVHLLEHLLHEVLGVVHHALFQVDDLVVLLLRQFQVAEDLFAHGDLRFAVGVVHDIDGEVVDDLRVGHADRLGIEGGKRIDDPHGERVLAILTDIGDHVGHAHHTALQRGGAQGLDGGLVGHAGLHQVVQLLEGGRVTQAQHLLGELAVVAEHPIERLQRDVAAVQVVEHPHRVHVVVEGAPGARAVAGREEPLAGVAEGGVARVVAERDGLNEVAVQPEQAPDAPGHAAHELHVQAAPRDLVVLGEGEHLGLVGVAVVGGQVQHLLDVAHEGRARERGAVVGEVLAAHHVRIIDAVGTHAARGPISPDGLFHLGIQGKVGDVVLCHGSLAFAGR